MPGIDLDNLFDEQKPNLENESGIQDLVISKPAAPKQSTATSLEKLVEQYKRLIYLIDRSGSTGGPMALNKKDPLEYVWPNDIRQQVRDALGPFASDEEQELLASLDTFSDNEVKTSILAIGPEKVGIMPVVKNPKIDVMKKAVADFADRRYEKYPDAQIIVATFDDSTEIESTSQAMLRPKLQALYPRGGTNITLAVTQVLDYLKKLPECISNHIVLVTDGEDWGAVQVKELIPRMKEMNVVLDYIYVKSDYDSDGTTSSEVSKAFKEICTELGGEYKECKYANDFEKVFLAASNRLALPPALKE